MTPATPVKKASSAAPTQKTTKAAAPGPAPVKAAPAKPVTVKPSVAKPAPVTSPKADNKKKDKNEKVKVVRDSFTIPKAEYAQIAAMKKRAVELGLETKKSELIRAGLLLLAATSDTAFRKALGNVPTLKTGRPGKV